MKTPALLTCLPLAAGLLTGPGLAQDSPPKQSKMTLRIEKHDDGKSNLTIEVDGKKIEKTLDLSDSGDALGDAVRKALEQKLGHEQPEAHGDAPPPPKPHGEAPHGKARPSAGFVGVVVEPLSPDAGAKLRILPGSGLRVSSVNAESPAGRAGLVNDDVLTQLDEQILVSPQQFRVLVAARKPGEKARLSYIHNGEPHTTVLEIGARPAELGDPLALTPEIDRPGDAEPRGPRAERREEGLQKRLRERAERLERQERPGHAEAEPERPDRPDRDGAGELREKLRDWGEKMRQDWQRQQKDWGERWNLEMKKARERGAEWNEQALKAQREALEKLTEQVKRAQEDAAKAREEASRALQEAKKAAREDAAKAHDETTKAREEAAKSVQDAKKSIEEQRKGAEEPKKSAEETKKEIR